MDKQAIQSSKWHKKLLELLTEDFITKNEFSRPGMLLNSHSATVWHYTANPGASDENHHDYFENLGKQNPNDQNPDCYASAHIFIDKDSGRIIIPLWEIAYHAGDSWYNANSIGIELCIEKDGSFQPATIERAVKVGALLQLLFGYKADRIIRHYDITKKLCPKPWVEQPELFAKFKRDVEAQIKVYLAEKEKSQALVNIEVNNKRLQVQGILRDGVSLLPIRAVSETVEGKVDWKEENKQVRVNGYNMTETFENGTGYASARELASVLGLTVEWDGKTKTVKLSKA